MRKVRASIVHISDLHFGTRIIRTQINPELLDTLHKLMKDEDISPHYLVISGDVADNPLPWAMKQAYKNICELAENAGIPPQRTLIIPGNHDYKFLGNIGLMRLTRIPFEIYFRRNWTERGDWQERQDWIHKKRLLRWSDYVSLFMNALRPRGRELRDRMQKIVDEERGVAIFGINSTPLFQWFGFATGRVRSDQVFELTDELRNNRDRWANFFRVAVVHHHPLPISYDHLSTPRRIQESLMVFYNAGGFLRELARNGVDLVLHGHKHVSSFARAVYDFEDGTRRSIGVLAAGSATHKKPDDPLGNEFNVIRLFDDDTVTIDRWYYAPDVRRKDESSRYFLYELNDVKERHRRLDERVLGMRIGQVSKTVRLTHDGFSQIEVNFNDCRVYNPDGLNAYKFEDLEVQRPAYIRGLEVIRPGTTFIFPTIDYLEGSHLRNVKARVWFGETRTPADPPFDLRFRYRLMNGHALSLKEFHRKYAGTKYVGDQLNWEYASILCGQASEYIKLTVSFPKDYCMDDVEDCDVVALYFPDRGSDIPQQHEHETSRIRGKLRRQKRRLILDVVSPVPGFMYRIRWSYKAVFVRKVPSVLQERAVQSIQAKLINIARNVDGGTKSLADYQRIVELLNKFLAGIKSRYRETDRTEELDISLAIFDSNESALRFVACNFAAIGKLIDDTFMPGEGCEGFAFEKGSVLFYDHGRDSLEFYIMPNELKIETGEQSALGKYEVLVSIPWIHKSGIVVGVVNISSQSKYSRLLHLLDLLPSEQQEEKNFLGTLTQTLSEAIIGDLDQRTAGVTEE